MLSNLSRRLNNKIYSLVKQRKAKNIATLTSKLAGSEPVVVLGNQKTGSTAIAALLAQATSQSVTLDMLNAIPDVGWQLCVKYGVTQFGEVAYRYKEDFYRKIIKEPNLTFFYDEMLELLPNAKFIFIHRNPYQNIRSILNRLKIPGNLSDIQYDDWPELLNTPAWRLALDSSWLGRPQGSYIESMAHRWDVAACTYLDCKDIFISIRYEDFVKNKKQAIESLAAQLGLEVREDISESVDVQRQPKGNGNVLPEEFFGEANLKIVRDICCDSARKLGYQL